MFSLDFNWQQRNVLLRVQLSYFMRDCMRTLPPQHKSLFTLVTNWHDAYARPWTQLAVFMKLTGIVSMQICHCSRSTTGLQWMYLLQILFAYILYLPFNVCLNYDVFANSYVFVVITKIFVDTKTSNNLESSF